MTKLSLPVFSHPGIILFPGLHISLHIFEPQYRKLVEEIAEKDGRLAVIQPNLHQPENTAASSKPPFFSIGCYARITAMEKLPEGRYNVELRGLARLKLIEQIEAQTPYRQINAELIENPDDEGVLSNVERASLEKEARDYAEAHDYNVDWQSITRMDDGALVNGICQIIPFDAAAKQALLEADDIAARSEMLIQLMRFYALHDSDEKRVHLQ